MVKAVRGMRDILPAYSERWRQVEATVLQTLRSYSYAEVRLPLLEYTELFARGVGEATDIIEKEMYSLADRDGDSLSLRPEGTASYHGYKCPERHYCREGVCTVLDANDKAGTRSYDLADLTAQALPTWAKRCARSRQAPLLVCVPKGNAPYVAISRARSRPVHKFNR